MRASALSGLSLGDLEMVCDGLFGLVVLQPLLADPFWKVEYPERVSVRCPFLGTLLAG